MQQPHQRCPGRQPCGLPGAQSKRRTARRPEHVRVCYCCSVAPARGLRRACVSQQPAAGSALMGTLTAADLS